LDKCVLTLNAYVACSSRVHECGISCHWKKAVGLNIKGCCDYTGRGEECILKLGDSKGPHLAIIDVCHAQSRVPSLQGEPRRG